jgi:hypothetical protein
MCVASHPHERGVVALLVDLFPLLLDGVAGWLHSAAAGVLERSPGRRQVACERAGMRPTHRAKPSALHDPCHVVQVHAAARPVSLRKLKLPGRCGAVVSRRARCLRWTLPSLSDTRLWRCG